MICYFCEESFTITDPEYTHVCEECRASIVSHFDFDFDTSGKESNADVFADEVINAFHKFSEDLPKRWARKRTLK